MHAADCRAGGAQARDADSNAPKLLDDPTVIWPDDVKVDIQTVRDALFAQAAVDGELAMATTIEDVQAIQWPDTTASSTASQRLRSRLGLSADAMAGC